MALSPQSYKNTTEKFNSIVSFQKSWPNYSRLSADQQFHVGTTFCLVETFSLSSSKKVRLYSRYLQNSDPHTKTVKRINSTGGQS